jgi:hypothetical protein
MGISVRSYLTTGVAAMTAATIAFVPSVKEPMPAASHPSVVQVASPTVQLAAQTRNAADNPAFSAFVAAAQRLTPSAIVAIPRPGDAPPAPSAALLAFPGLGQAIRTTYDVVEFWVDYAVDWADYLLGWVLFGYLIGDQVQIFYTELEPIAKSITYNISFWIDGSISFGQGLSNVINDSINAGIGLANAEIA